MNVIPCVIQPQTYFGFQKSSDFTKCKNCDLSCSLKLNVIEMIMLPEFIPLQNIKLWLISYYCTFTLDIIQFDGVPGKT